MDDSTFQFLPISGNFAEPLKRSGPTFQDSLPGHFIRYLLNYHKHLISQSHGYTSTEGISVGTTWSMVPGGLV